ncbi:MAG TPA: DUF1800 domain-containing protein [Mycobacteriales bacterium]|nr:DUF1800 domain-containing protein [Mycobacteriales bacterium]
MRVSRRALLQAGTAGVVVAGTGMAQAGGAITGSRRPPPRRLALSTDPALHAARRLTYGPTPELLGRIRSVGVEAWIDEQLAPSLLPDVEVERILATFPTLRMSNAMIAKAYAEDRRPVVRDLQAAAVVRAVWSTRQLLELMVETWSNHLHVHLHHEHAGLLKTVDDREVIRPYALGRFADLLAASARSPAMLTYLNNWRSSGTNPNEDYGRELLELHTLGVDGGYTEADVKHVALALTGWDVDRSTWNFVYSPERHYVGPLKVLGWRSPNADARDGVATGLSLLDYLAHHPSTARHIARRLCVRFISDDPPASLIASAAKIYLAEDTAIVPVLRHILTSQAFRTSIGLKFRRPVELLAANLRALGARYDLGGGSDAAADLVFLLQGLGQPPFGWQTPDGYPDRAPAWISTQAMLGRWNLAQHLAVLGVRGLSGPRPERLLAGAAPKTAGALVDALCERLAFQRFSGAHRSALLAATGRADAAPLSEADVASLTPALGALVLSSPYLQVR